MRFKASQFAIVILLFGIMLPLSHATTISVTIPAAATYLGNYWQYSTTVQATLTDSRLYGYCFGYNFYADVAWGDGGGSWNPLIWGSGSQIINGYYYYGGQCNVGYISVPSGLGYPAVGYQTDSNPNIMATHTYSSLGKYHIYNNDSCASSSCGGSWSGSTAAMVYLFQSPNLAFSISGYNAVDLGSLITFYTYASCGSGTYCASLTYPGYSGGTFSSPASGYPTYTTNSVGIQNAQLCSYDPVLGYNICTSNSVYNVYPKISIPTMNAVTSNQLSGVSYTYTVNVPQQCTGACTGSNNEGAPKLIINFGDGSSQTITGWTIPSGTNDWQTSFTHTYTIGNYVFTANAQSYNYYAEGSSYGSTNSMTANINVIPYTKASFSSMTPNTVLEANSVIYTVNLIQGNFAIKNTTVQWGDGVSNVLTSSSNSVNFAHAYAYVAGAKPNTFHANVTVCDTNLVCSNTIQDISGTYTIPILNVITSNTANIIATMPVSFTFNIIQGNYPIAGLQINWGDGKSNTVSTNSLAPSVLHNYTAIGNYIINATAYDSNYATSNILPKALSVNPYVLPSISTLSPTSATSTTNTLYSFTATTGTFALATTNTIIIDFGWGNAIYLSNIPSGTNSIYFEYGTYAGSFSTIAKIYDINGRDSRSITLIDVSAYPWNFTVTNTIINYNVTNVSTTKQRQTNQTSAFNINYTLQDNNFVNDYICTSSMSNSSNSLYSISCILNPFSISYSNQTLYETISATDIYGVVKSITLQINLFTVVNAPVTPGAPFSYNTPPPPLKTTPFLPLDNNLLIEIGAAVIVIMAILGFAMHGKKNED